MTKEDIVKTFGKDAGPQKIKSLVEQEKYIEDPEFPGGENFYLLSVYIGTKQALAP